MALLALGMDCAAEQAAARAESSGVDMAGTRRAMLERRRGAFRARRREPPTKVRSHRGPLAHTEGEASGDSRREKTGCDVAHSTAAERVGTVPQDDVRWRANSRQKSDVGWREDARRKDDASWGDDIRMTESASWGCLQSGCSYAQDLRGRVPDPRIVGAKREQPSAPGTEIGGGSSVGGALRGEAGLSDCLARLMLSWEVVESGGAVAVRQADGTLSVAGEMPPRAVKIVPEE